MPFFDKFPTVAYDITKGQYSNYQNVTNIFFRLKMVQEALGDIAAYYEYTIKDGDTPENLAENVYGDAEAHWVILMANNIVDHAYDWPLDHRSFIEYIKKKYDLVSLAKSQIHHYEKVIRREESKSGVVTETRFVIDLDTTNQVELEVPYDSYTSLADTQYVEGFNMPDGSTVIQTSYRDSVTNWDWEMQQNENKRLIKIIKPDYYGTIVSELDALLDNPGAPFLRRFSQ